MLLTTTVSEEHAEASVGTNIPMIDGLGAFRLLIDSTTTCFYNRQMGIAETYQYQTGGGIQPSRRERGRAAWGGDAGDQSSQ